MAKVLTGVGLTLLVVALFCIPALFVVSIFLHWQVITTFFIGMGMLLEGFFCWLILWDRIKED